VPSASHNDERGQPLAYKHPLTTRVTALFSHYRGMNVGRRLPINGLGLHNIRREIHTLALRVYSDFDVGELSPCDYAYRVGLCAPCTPPPPKLLRQREVSGSSWTTRDVTARQPNDSCCSTRTAVDSRMAGISFTDESTHLSPHLVAPRDQLSIING
jgi:hypothetical protein